MARDEELAAEVLDRITNTASKTDYAALMILVQKHSMQWLVDVCQRKVPSSMAISVSTLLASFPTVDDKNDASVDEAS